MNQFVFLIVSAFLLCPSFAQDCVVTADYPACTAPAVTPQRLRKEVRSLSSDEWSKVVDAMWMMKTETMISGQDKYGSAFKTWDYFVVKHAVAFSDSRGDQAHLGAHFITWHGAFVLEFENALLSVDPTLSGMPYWDQTISNPSIFTDEYFGQDPGPETDYQVTTGKFANWPIMSSFDISDWSDYIVDDSTVTFKGTGGFLRGTNNTNAFSTRYGSGEAYMAAAKEVTPDDWWSCTTEEARDDWNKFNWCIEGSYASLLHMGPHQIIGGKMGDKSGDFEDPSTSPNAPLFMFHHSNIERSKMWWMRAHSEIQCTYYNFPIASGGIPSLMLGSNGNTDELMALWSLGAAAGGVAEEMPATLPGPYVGSNLNDVTSSSWGFTAEDLGFDAGLAGTGQLTHADLLCWLGPETAPYTFDSHAKCLADTNKCNPLQAAIFDGRDSDDEDALVQTSSSSRLTGVSRQVAVLLSLIVANLRL
eukprot:CAMPEP_0181311386 /NCGR_PEP_ID=MMETSP1101-20121128/13106_1 /TAXON_ID=46948 /ORGANISM="Rhodomonas abbreviata, Strain Caron Lab Isolate" /LENGTH=474 /DNA_ID=CAMNT_0023418107 /DNA_START=127 /DNA_END=1551 /DNA_ORIENTATION=-